MNIENEAYRTPEAPLTQRGADSPSVFRLLYVHAIALLGASFVFVGGFLAAWIPSMIFEFVSTSETWAYVQLVAGIVLGLICAVLSYRGTLRVHAKPRS